MTGIPGGVRAIKKYGRDHRIEPQGGRIPQRLRSKGPSGVARFHIMKIAGGCGAAAGRSGG